MGEKLEKIAVSAIRRQRHLDVPVPGGKHTLVIEIPTDRTFFRVIESNPTLSDTLLNCELVKECVIGWKDVKDSDLVSSGTEDPAVFDKANFGEWFDDRAEWWGPLANAIIEARTARKAQREADAGN